jgi:hypothetical protein
MKKDNAEPYIPLESSTLPGYIGIVSNKAMASRRRAGQIAKLDITQWY